jgi:hypothetical protein
MNRQMSWRIVVLSLVLVALGALTPRPAHACPTCNPACGSGQSCCVYLMGGRCHEVCVTNGDSCPPSLPASNAQAEATPIFNDLQQPQICRLDSAARPSFSLGAPTR